MPDVFISYAKPDRERARRIVETLRAHGWSVWCDRVVPEERQLVEVVQEAFAAARCIVVLWSSVSVASERVFNEARGAMRQRRLVCVRIEEVEVSGAFHRVELVDLAHWKNDGPPPLSSLTDAVNRRIGPPRGEAEPVEPTPVESPIAFVRMQAANAMRPFAARIGAAGPRAAIVAGVLVLAVFVVFVAGRQILAPRTGGRSEAPGRPEALPAPVAQAIKGQALPSTTTYAPAAERGWTADEGGCKVANPNPRPNETMTWSGACRHGKALGPGVVTWFENGRKRASVKGEWRDGKPIETILFTDYANDQTYEGVQEEGQWIGKVVVTGRWGRIEGPVVDGAVTGYGTFKGSNGRRYEGAFVDGKFAGKGALTDPDGTHYVGEFAAGLFDGTGALTRPDHSRYEGDFRKGVQTGKGVFVSASGDRYAGDFVDGKFDGQGVLTTQKGGRHEGRFVAGQFVQ